MKKSLNVNGFSLEAEYEDRFVRETLIPLLTELSDAYFRKRKRQIVFLAGPPAAGKSTLALFLEYLSSNNWIVGKSAGPEHGWLSLSQCISGYPLHGKKRKANPSAPDQRCSGNIRHDGPEACTGTDLSV